MSTVEVRVKSTGSEGTSIVPGTAPAPVRRIRAGAEVRLVPFMLEDYLDSIEARAALEDPANGDPIPWHQVKGQLGL